MKTLLKGAAVALALSTFGANAASVIVNPPVSAPAGNNSFKGNLEALYGQGNVGFAFLEDILTDDGDELTFTLVGAESGYTNTFTVDDGTGAQSLTESNEAWGSYASFSITTLVGTALSWLPTFEFSASNTNKGVTAGLGDVGMGVFFDLALWDNGAGDLTEFFLGFDDQGRVNDNHDDMMVQVSIQPGRVGEEVPLPATAWLFASAIAGCTVLRRRFKPAA